MKRRGPAIAVRCSRSAAHRTLMAAAIALAAASCGERSQPLSEAVTRPVEVKPSKSAPATKAPAAKPESRSTAIGKKPVGNASAAKNDTQNIERTRPKSADLSRSSPKQAAPPGQASPKSPGKAPPQKPAADATKAGSAATLGTREKTPDQSTFHAAKVEPPSYKTVSNAQKSRSALLSRIWARAVASITFIDNEGAERREQGEGHFQVIQPSRLALSIGKLGDVFLWIGCDEERYWLIDAKENKRAYVGRHDQVTAKKIAALGLPVPPRDLITLAGISPLDEAGRSATTPKVVRDEASAALTINIQRRAPFPARWRTSFDAAKLLPIEYQVFEGGSESPALTAILEEYRDVKIAGRSGLYPQIATRISADHFETRSSMRLTLTDVSDGGKSKLRPEAFEFEKLVELLGVQDVIDLDAELE